MKIVAYMVLIISLLGCGQPEDFTVDISSTTVLWQGRIDSDPWMLKTFNETSTCIDNFGFQRSGYPEVTIVDTWFYCNGNINYGCISFSENRIYIADTFSCNSSVLSAFHESSCYLLRHEIIHWITLLGNRIHESNFMIECEQNPYP